MGPLILLACSGGRDSGGFDSACFVDGTRIDTPDGPRAIESLAPGDIVWSMDTATRQRVPRRVVRRIEARSTRLARVQVGQRVIHGVTPQHPFYDPERDRWVQARDLAPGQPVALATGPATVDAISWRDEVATVHDLTLEGPEHNFFAEGVLVHNKSYPEPWEEEERPDVLYPAHFGVGLELPINQGQPGVYFWGDEGPRPAVFWVGLGGPYLNCVERFTVTGWTPATVPDTLDARTLELQALDGTCADLDPDVWGDDPAQVLLQTEWTIVRVPPAEHILDAYQESIEDAGFSWEEWQPSVVGLRSDLADTDGGAVTYALDDQNTVVVDGSGRPQPQASSDTFPEQGLLWGSVVDIPIDRLPLPDG